MNSQAFFFSVQNCLDRSSRTPLCYSVANKLLVFSIKHTPIFVVPLSFKPRSSFSSYGLHEVHELRGLRW